MSPRRFARLISLTLYPMVLCLAGATCGRARGPSVLLISVDSLRLDHTSFGGYRRATTPVLDGLGKEGTIWTSVSTPAPWTTPSMMSVMTGLYPDTHHVEEDDRYLDGKTPTLAQRFHDAGYATGGFVPEATLSGRFGFARGFDLYDERSFGHRSVASPAQSSAVIHWLETTRGPFFCWVHLWDPHYNYNPAPPYDSVFPAEPARSPRSYDILELKSRRFPLEPDEIEDVMRLYDEEVLMTDHYVGEMLDMLRASGRLDTTLVIVLGDHGEAFQEHGWLTHTNTVYEETIRVPVLARLPGTIPAGRRIAVARSLVDVTEAVAAWAGLPPVKTQSAGLPVEAFASHGGAVSNSATVTGDPAGPPAPEDPLIVSTTRRQATVLSARCGRWSLILAYSTCERELYDLQDDPAQKHDLFRDRPDIVRALDERLRIWTERGRREHPVPLRRLQEDDPELFRKLGALGYVDLFGDRLGQRSNADPMDCLRKPSSPR